MLSQAGAYIALHPLHSLHQKLFQLLYLQQGEYSLGSSFCYLIIDETLKLLPSKSTLLFHKGFSKETLVWGNTSSEGKGLTPSYAKAFCQHIVILGQSLPSVFIGVWGHSSYLVVCWTHSLGSNLWLDPYIRWSEFIFIVIKLHKTSSCIKLLAGISEQKAVNTQWG